MKIEYETIVKYENTNSSKNKRIKIIEVLNNLKNEHTDDKYIIAFNEIENFLTEKKFGLVWEEHIERVDKELETKIPIFSEEIDKEINDKPDEDYNFLLEGDNLHSIYPELFMTF